MASQYHSFRAPFTGALVKSSAGKALLALVCVLFLTAQAIDLSHSHGNDLSQQADCDICLKLGSEDDVLVNGAEPIVEAAHSEQPEFTPSAWFNQESLGAQARAPPLA